MKKKNNDVVDVDPYKLDKASRVPSWLIIIVLKYWAAAAASYFIAIGGQEIGLIFSVESTDPIDIIWGNIKLIVLMGLFMAIFFYIVIRNVTRMLYNRRNNTFKYNMVNFRGFLSFFACLAYTMLLSIILYFVVVLLHDYIPDPFGVGSRGGIEPFSYGLFFIIVDFIFLVFKNIIIMIKERVIYSKQIKGA